MKKEERDLLIKRIEQVESSTIQDEDIAYWRYHRTRYIKTLSSILKTFKKSNFSKIRILDIGSHYLHLPLILKKYGFDVYGFDIADFTNSCLIKKRANDKKIENRTIHNSLEEGKFPYNKNEKFDLILFTETLEHLPFRPQKMWVEVFKLLKDEGRIYITTPNSLSIRRISLQFLRIITRDGYGPKIDDILSKPSYAIHWKEYSPKEIYKYFKTLGYNVEIKINFYSYKKLLRSLSPFDLIGMLINLFSFPIKHFREELEIWISLNKEKRNSCPR